MNANDSSLVKSGDIVTSLSTKTINRARQKEALGHGMTKFPLAIGGLGLFGLFLFGAWPLAVVAGVGGFVGLGNWFNQYVLRGHENTRVYIHRVKAEIQRLEQSKRDQVGPLLEESLRDNPEARDQIESALSQFRHIGESFASFMEVLGRRLDSNEFTFGVYAAPAEQATFGVYDALEEIVTILKAIGSIDVHELQERIRELEGQQELSPRKEGILKELKDRVQLNQEELAHIEQLILENAQSITALERVTSAISKMRSQGRQNKFSHQGVLNELLKVSDRSKQLDDSQPQI